MMFVVNNMRGGHGGPYTMKRQPSSSDDDEFPPYHGFGGGNISPEAETDHEDEEEEDYDIPDLNDIIPWAPNPEQNPPPLVDVSDVVRTEDGISVSFLRNVLKSYHAKDGVVREVTVNYFSETLLQIPNKSLRNILTDVHVNATIEDHTETFHMIIKTLTTSQPFGELSSKFLFDKREVAFYNQILENINVFQHQQLPDANEYISVPSSKCFFVRYKALNEETALEGAHSVQAPESVIVLENVKYHGFTQTLIEEGLSKEQVLTVFEGISRMHGISLAMKERSGIPLEKSYPFLICMKQATTCIETLFDRNVHDILCVAKEMGAARICIKLMNIRPHLQGLIDTLTSTEERLSVISHTNLWAHNILFKGDECIFVDWQMISCLRPTYDLAFLLASSVKPPVRREHTKLFLKHYYSHFAAYALRYGLDIERDLDYTFHEFEMEFRHSQLLALMCCIAKAEDVANTRETIIRLVDYMQELEENDILNLDVISVHLPEEDLDAPHNRERLNALRPRRRPSLTEMDKIYGMFPMDNPPED